MAKGKNLKQKLETLHAWAKEKGLPKKPKNTDRQDYVPNSKPVIF